MQAKLQLFTMFEAIFLCRFWDTKNEVTMLVMQQPRNQPLLSKKQPDEQFGLLQLYPLPEAEASKTKPGIEYVLLRRWDLSRRLTCTELLPSMDSAETDYGRSPRMMISG
jgi:hypothetical protein